MSEGVSFDYLMDIGGSEVASNQDIQEDIKDLIASEYNFLYPYIDSLYFIEANSIYLNYIAKITQTEIANIFNIKQYGISKRISSALKRLNIQLKAPDGDTEDSYKFISNILSPTSSYTLVIWYNLKTVSATTQILRASSNAVTKVLRDIKDQLLKLRSCEDSRSMVAKIIEYQKGKIYNEEFLLDLLENKSSYYVVKHKIGNHINYIQELLDYNSRGSHNFRKKLD